MNRFTLMFMLLSSTAFGQGKQTSVAGQSFISWNEYYRLDWQDFQGSPLENSIGDAGAVVQIKAKPHRVKKQIRYDVEALFNRNKSWARDQSPALLAHEQLHFDIAEWYARKIRKKIEELNERDVSDVKIFNAAISELLAESNETDRQYDIETLHGAISKKQQVWSDKVRDGLLSLSKYKKPKRIIKAG